MQAFVLPALPTRLQRAWAHQRARKSERLPSFFSEEARCHPAVSLATDPFYEARIDRNFAQEVLRWLSTPSVVGAFSTHQHLASQLGLRLASPLLDRRVIELVLGIPIEWMLSSDYRAFLREAAQGRIPEETRLRRKDDRLASDLMHAIMSSRGTRELLRDEHVRDRLSRWVRFERVEGNLQAIGRGYDPDDHVFWQQITGIVGFAYWFARASREYGIR
jgi:hypothetical protein